MRSLFVVLVAAAALIMVSVDGYAADYELVGGTTATFAGNSGLRVMTEGCQAEFGSDTRMCNSVEVIETVNWPSPQATPAWTSPVFAPNQSSLTFDRDASGVSLAGDVIGSLSCQAWADSGSSAWGLVLFNGRMSATTCSTPRPVACCGPVPVAMVATVPFIGLFGRGLVIALMLSAAGAMLLRGGQRAAALVGAGNRSLRG